jgi:hypothetical protein
MQQNLARLGLAVLSIAMLAIGVLSIVDFWPRWVWISLGALGLVGIIGSVRLAAARQWWRTLEHRHGEPDPARRGEGVNEQPGRARHQHQPAAA